MGMTSRDLSLSQVSINSSNVSGAFSGSRPALSNISLLYAHAMPQEYQLVLYVLPSYWFMQVGDASSSILASISPSSGSK